MPKAARTSANASQTPYTISIGKKRGLLAQPGAATLENIQALQKTGLTLHSKAANTTTKYRQARASARKWLRTTIEAGTAELKGKSKATPSGDNSESSDEDDSEDEDEGGQEHGNGPDPMAPNIGNDPEDANESFQFTSPDYKKALDDIPNKHSPKVLSLYLTYKIFHQGRKIGTADTARAAFLGAWNMVDGDTYRGRWHYNIDSKRWEGNPVESADVEDVMKAIKNKCGQDGGERTHSLAMSKENMARIFSWSDKVCPPETYFAEAKTTGERTLRTKHLMYKAFSSTGWTIWTRNFELIKLREGDLTFGLEDPKAFNTPYFELRLLNRKGWQRKISKAQKEADLRSGKYKVCPQPDLPACDAHHWLPLWRKYLQDVVYRRPLTPDDYIFPAIGANGVVQVGEHVSHEDVQKWITEFTTGAGVAQANGNFTTHCFRRGGAQYRFMFAPVGRRWTLRQVRWWGGWADGEHRDTLIKYLLDELGTYEDDYSGMLLPNRPDFDQTFLGEGSSITAATTGQLTLMHQSLSTEMREISGTLGNLVDVFSKANIRNEPAVITASPISASIRTQHPSYAGHQMHNHSQPTYFGTRPIIPISVPASTHKTFFPQATPPPILAAPAPAAAAPQNTPYLVVPDIPVTLPDGTRSHTRDSWRYAVEHWLHGDVAHGLETPLKDWPKKWLTGPNKKFAMKHRSRMLIATEFISRYNSDEDSFLAAYPAAERGFSKLLDAINAARAARGDRMPRK
ncbi:hypothetical protein C8F04DRAFT_1272533 [Mycena alexandri]|uniref:Uncharacterized protein n=1 Tax=Mycena alexandri TaxID=1745969 RepID=A0AAD6WVE4_9AGAR|nr:hypothetical protein C8F04DRAFT_1272531 [Mycena alexandri]KAJ7022526.1 hypothetical protein C8F04DRAFT_1272533 [Mycena alexandri]